MKNKKWLIIVCAILAVALIIGGLAFAFSATGDSDNRKEKGKNGKIRKIMWKYKNNQEMM